MDKAFPSSSFSNKLVLIAAMLIFASAIIFIISDKINLGVAAIWIAAGVLWLLRYAWQVKNPYIQITKNELTINKSPVLVKRIRTNELRKVIGSGKYSLKVVLQNGKKVKIPLLQVEKDSRPELAEQVEMLCSENSAGKTNGK